jgi:hypothetical protein
MVISKQFRGFVMKGCILKGGGGWGRGGGKTVPFVEHDDRARLCRWCRLLMRWRW